MSENHNQSPSSEKKIYSIGLHRIRPMQNHPFSVRDDEEMTALMESIRQYGVLTPITVRAIRKENSNETDYFEIISGHRRYHACKRLKLDRIPANILNLNRNQAVIAMVDSNLHREHLLPSEKAFAYKMKLEALDRQGQKPTLCSQDTKPVDSATEIAESAEESRRQIFRYIRLTYLAKGLLDLVDAGRIAFRPAVELSYLNEQEQADLLEIIETEERTPSLSQAVRLKKISREGNLTPERIAEIMAEEKANQKETIKISSEVLRDYLPDGMGSQDFIVKACAYYAQYLRRCRDREVR